ncbi:MAG TPA: phosphodiester glycosidase family protein [Balneolaceae bacterium]|nr:phosphodiester glycosidase family protein [Balneolaceae bacterium]
MILKKSLFLLTLTFTSVWSSVAQLPPPPPGNMEQAGFSLEWETERLSPGIYWKAYLGDGLYDSKQSINLVEVWLDSTDADLQIGFVQDTLALTSTLAEQAGADIAINGSFFDTRAGGSVVFMRVDGDIIARGAPNRQLYTENGGLAWNTPNEPVIIKRPEEGWAEASFENVLTSGPLLILADTLQMFNNDSFNQNRHPRTALAITDDNRLLLLTVDGRSFQGYGMTIPETAELLDNLGAGSALNLDGGGSTTMWIRGKSENNIVNYPSDNLEFDRLGERKVSNALLLIVEE